MALAALYHNNVGHSEEWCCSQITSQKENTLAESAENFGIGLI